MRMIAHTDLCLVEVVEQLVCGLDQPLLVQELMEMARSSAHKSIATAINPAREPIAIPFRELVGKPL